MKNSFAITSNIKKLVKALNLGQMLTPPHLLTGGLSHISCQVDTEQGSFVIKTLNATVMQRVEAPDNYRRSEALAQLLSDEISTVPAIPFNNDVLIPFEGKFYMVFPFVLGKTLTLDEISPVHCAKIGAILGQIHARKILIPESTVTKCPLYSWQTYGLSKKQVEDLNKLNKQAHTALSLLNQNSVMSHRDLDPKNVLWNGEKPHIIDWEAAGMLSPAIELWEACVNWCQNLKGEIYPERINVLLSAYTQYNQLPKLDWAVVSSAGYAGMLGWLHYNLLRSTSTTIPMEERILGKEQVAKTLEELFTYQAKQNKIMQHWNL